MFKIKELISGDWMNRKKFVFAWGRKIFFGLSLPLSCLLGAIYLKGHVLPQGITEWIYFTLSTVGHFGLLNALAYFVLFAPVVALMPSYYIARFWSITLVIALNLFILVDAISYSQYQMHIYSFLGKLYWESGLEYLMPSQLMMGVVAALFCYAVFLWIRGESYWRQMQGRFSNPIRNWYVVLILFSFIASKGLYYYGDVHPEISHLIPMDVNLPKVVSQRNEKRNFHYPKNLLCNGKQTPNFIMVTLKEWGSDELTLERMPHVFAMKRHAVNFINHHNVAFNSQSGLFSLFYSIPASYESMVVNTKPFFLDEMNKRQYEILDWGRSNEEAFTTFKNWATERPEDDEKPFFISLVVNRKASEADVMIQEMVSILQKQGLLNNTHIVLTGGNSGQDFNQRIPLLYFTPERKFAEVTHATTHYDVIPTLVSKMWNCKNAYELTGVGKSLWDQERSWLLATGAGHLKITDLETNAIMEVLGGSLKIEGPARKEIVFPVIKLVNKFSF